MISSRITVLDEPKLEFRYGQSVTDPHIGLGLFGPPDTDEPGHPHGVPYAVIGSEPGPSGFLKFAEKARGPVVSYAYGDPSVLSKDRVLWPPFPGVEAAFHIDWPHGSAWLGKVSRERVLESIRDKDPYKRAYDVCNMYLDAIRIAVERDENLVVIVCVVPDEVWDACRPESRIAEGFGRRPTKQELEVRRVQPNLFGDYAPEQYELSVDFRRQLKARAMEFNVPIQIVRESTIEVGPWAEERRLSPPSDCFWNLLTTFYYKAGGKPWRLAGAREGVCYIGLAFRRGEATKDARTACCAAQMFLDTGDGVVFRGEFGPWYSPKTKQFQLDRAAARALLEGVLKVYHEQGGKDLKEVFLHSRSRISLDEYSGYCEACPSRVKVVGVRVRRDPWMGLYRKGTRPVLRGTLWEVGERTTCLWTSGFKPELFTYDGWEVPRPLRIDIQHGDADIRQVSRDIFGLTKLNYNACKVGDSQPVTVGFSDAVGEILITNPNVKSRKPNFKFYI
jgi:hypothetical protein